MHWIEEIQLGVLHVNLFSQGNFVKSTWTWKDKKQLGNKHS
jgi:hypothetical protein